MSFRLEFPVVERVSVWKEARLGNSFTMREYNAVRYHNLVGNSGNVVDMHTLYELCEELRRDVVEDYDFSVSPSDSGYCYLEYIQKEYWAYVAELLGKGPSAADVLKAATLVPADCGTVSLLKSDTGWHAKRDVKAEVQGWVKALSAEDKQRLKVGAAVMKFVPGKGLQVEQVLPDSWFGGPRLTPLQRLAVVEPMAVVGGGAALVPEVKAGASGSGHAFDSVAGETFSVETPEGYLNCGSECRLGAECMFVHVRDGFLNGCPVHRIGKAVWQGDGKVSHDDRQAARQAAVYCVDRREVAMREYKGVSLSVYKECYQTCMLPKFMGATYGTRVREYSGSDGDSDYGDEDDEIVGGYREIYSRLVKRRPPIKVSSDYLKEYRRVVDYWLEPAGLECSRIPDADLLRLLLDEKFRSQWAKTGPGERGADVALALARRIRVATMPGLMLGAGKSEDPMGLMVQLGMAVLWLVTSRLAHG